MLASHVTTAFRHLRSRPASSAINIAGLAIGLAACLLIALYVHDELSYDRFHANGERTYRVLREFDSSNLRATIAATPIALAAALDGVPGIERAVRVAEETARVRAPDGREIVESGFAFADDGFFDVFSFEVLRGSVKLDRPGTLLITESAAARYFAPGADPIGEVLAVEDADHEITGVLADPPPSSHLRFEFLAAVPDEPQPADGREWSINTLSTYVLLEPAADKGRVTAEITRVIAERNTSPSADGNNFIPHLQPLAGIHFGRGVPVAIAADGNPLHVPLFAALAACILLAACVNFTNLATARASERAREIGVRKTLGAARRQLAMQFLGESILTSAMSLMLALGLSKLALPYFNTLARKALSLEPLYAGPNVLAVLGLTALVGVAAGLYPALALSGFDNVRALKGGPVRGSGTGERLRKTLVVIQLTVSTGMIAATAIVLEQFGYLRDAGLGFDPENVLVVAHADYLDDRVEVFEQELARLPGVESVTAAFSVPGTFFMNSTWRTNEPGAAAHNLDYTLIDSEYAETLALEIVAGRAPSAELAGDTTAVLLNESATQTFGWSLDEAVGKRLEGVLTVVGVTRDFNYRSLHTAVNPLMLVVRSEAIPFARSAPRYVAARIDSGDPTRVVDGAEALWRRFSDLPFRFSWLADDLRAQYGAEQRLATVFATFAGLAVLVACLGLLGLAAFAVGQRRKEIGVRKVLGASRTRVLTLLSAEYAMLVGAAFAIATPIAYAGMQRWLQGFAYRTELGWQPFLLAGALAAGSALIAVGAQVLRAASTHPARALRHE